MPPPRRGQPWAPRWGAVLGLALMGCSAPATLRFGAAAPRLSTVTAARLVDGRLTARPCAGGEPDPGHALADLDLLQPVRLRLPPGRWCGVTVEVGAGEGLQVEGLTPAGAGFVVALGGQRATLAQPIGPPDERALVLELDALLPIAAIDQRARESGARAVEIGPRDHLLEGMLAEALWLLPPEEAAARWGGAWDERSVPAEGCARSGDDGPAEGPRGRDSGGAGPAHAGDSGGGDGGGDGGAPDSGDRAPARAGCGCARPEDRGCGGDDSGDTAAVALLALAFASGRRRRQR